MRATGSAKLMAVQYWLPTISRAMSRAGGLILATQHRERLANDARQRATSSQAKRHAPRQQDGVTQSTDQPLVPLVRRRTGVKNGCGTARDVVTFLARLRPRISLAPGAGFLRGCSLSLRAVRHEVARCE